MHVCMWLREISCLFEDNFFGKGQKSFRTIWGQTALGLKVGGGQEGDCVSQVPTKSWALVCIDSTWGVDKAQPLGPDRLDLGKSLYCSL